MRRGIAAGAALTIALLAAMPMQAAVAARPYRSPFRSPVGFVGEGAEVGVVFESAKQNPCGFESMTEFKNIYIDTLFSDGHETSHIVAFITTTNLENGTSFTQTSDYYRTITYLADGTQSVVINGSRAMAFYEGEPGPEGVVGRGGALYYVTGRQSYVYDPKKDVISSYEFRGLSIIDTCDLLR